MKYIYLILLIISLIATISCEEEIEWEVEEMPEMLVVEGSFTNEYKKHQVQLTKSAGYFSNKQTPRVSGAEVTISDGMNTISLEENPVGSGIYETVDSVAGEAGKTYTLDIQLNEPINNTAHYFASGELIQGLDIDSMIASIYENPIYMPEFDDDSLILFLAVLGFEPPDIKNYYELNLYKNDTMLNDTIDETYIVEDTEEMEGEYVNSFFFFEQFQIGDTVRFEIVSVEKLYRDFVIGVQNIANQSADPFDMSGPPANAIGNIQGAEAIGYFKVAYVSMGEAIVKLPEEE